MAERVVHTLLNTFVEDTLGIKRADTTGAQRFLEDELRDYEKRLADSEAALAEFKKKNLGLMPGEEGDYYTRLQTGMTRLEKLRTELRLASERRNELVKQLEGEEPVFGLDPDAQHKQTYSPLDAKIAEHKARLDALLLQYTDKHPDVIALRQTIADLEQQRAADEAKRPPPSRGGSGLNTNPVYQNMKIALSRTEVDIAELRAEIGTQEREVAQLRSKVDTIPEVEAQLQRLNRDYEVTKSQYNQVLQRLESAKISERAEESSEDLKFRIIEPPSTPLKPVAPNRPLLLSFILLVAIAFGVGLAVLMNQVRPVFSSRQVLRAVTGLPVLGYISLMRRPDDANPLWQRPVAAWCASGMLLVVYASVFVYAAFVRDVAT
jgi:polysaccharide chain length determinant protein (PEP-CTERM system associated)